MLIAQLVYLTQQSFTSWDREVINWIPNKPGNPTLDRRRPIALLEVFRNLTLGVKKTTSL